MCGSVSGCKNLRMCTSLTSSSNPQPEPRSRPRPRPHPSPSPFPPIALTPVVASTIPSSSNYTPRSSAVTSRGWACSPRSPPSSETMVCSVCSVCRMCRVRRVCRCLEGYCCRATPRYAALRRATPRYAHVPTPLLYRSTRSPHHPKASRRTWRRPSRRGRGRRSSYFNGCSHTRAGRRRS